MITSRWETDTIARTSAHPAHARTDRGGLARRWEGAPRASARRHTPSCVRGAVGREEQRVHVIHDGMWMDEETIAEAHVLEQVPT